MADSVAARLKQVRGDLAETQESMSQRFALGKRTWQNYERGIYPPTAHALQQLCRLGYDANWILTGRGKMRPIPVRDATQTHTSSVDETVMIAVVCALESEMVDMRVNLPSDRKAMAITALYDFAVSTTDSDQRSEIVARQVPRILRLVS